MLDLSKQDLHNRSEDKEVVLSIKNLSKRFCRDLKRSLLYGVQDIAGEVFGSQRQNVELRKGEFWALKDVNLELRRGEALGLVGANGAGKTTLLRIISGLISPDHGSVQVKGRVAPLIALGAGFNPILTGRENIYVNMSILGLSKEEIDDRFNDVVEFAEIDEAIDAPVQSYSSGMAARLGFACAIHTEPEILLIDEVLAVGDMRFRTKCYRRLSDIKKSGTTFILVSHSPQSILAICDTSIYLKQGLLISKGDTPKIIHDYENDLFQSKTEHLNNYLDLPEKESQESSGIDIVSLFFCDKNKKVTREIISGESISFCVRCKSRDNHSSIEMCLIIREVNGEGEPILNLVSSRDGILFDSPSGLVDFCLILPFCCLKSGSYMAKVWISQYPHFYLYDAVESFLFRVSSGCTQESAFYQPRQWTSTIP